MKYKMSFQSIAVALFFLVTGALATGALAAGTGQAADEERLNILFIVSEDNGPEIGCYGTPIKTPHLDELANSGVRFSNAYVPQAGCSQSRAAFLTGLYPHQNGQIGLATWNYSLYSKETPNIVGILKKAGYRTGVIGKLHVNPEEAFPFDFKAIPGGNSSRREMGSYVKNAATFFNESDKPFYLQISFPDAHWPFIKQVAGRPAKPLESEDVTELPFMGLKHPELKQLTADYYNCMMRLDSYIGDLLTALEESGKAKETVVVYIGDHGAEMPRGKRSCYEGGLRIPMIIRWPDSPTTLVREELVSSIDLFPTFCHIAGATPPANLPGRSLEALIKGESVEWRKYLFAEYHVHSNHNPWPSRSVRDERYKLIYNPVYGRVNPNYTHSFSYENRRLKATETEVMAHASPQVRKAYALMKEPPEYELYDLEKDPFEFMNLSADPAYAAQLEKLVDELKTWQRKTRDPLRDPRIAIKLYEMIRASTLDRNEFLPYKELMQPSSK